MIEIPLEPHGRTPLYRQIASHLRRMVQNGTLSYEDRLPGSRELAQTNGVSRATVVLAYDLLEDDGFIEQRGRRGSFVSWKKARISADSRDRDPIWDLASGLPSGDLVPWDRVASLASEALFAAGPDALYDTPTEGLPGLREALVRHAARRGIPARRDEAIVTSGARHALSVSIDAMALKGVRTLWVEELTYPEIRRMAAASGLNVRTVPMDSSLFVDSLSCIGKREVLYLIPSFHNPTGRTLSIDVRRMVLSAASERGFWVIEDDAYGELRFGEASVPALKSIDGENRVLYLGSFSQLLFPGMRIGYVLLPDEIKKEFLSVLERTSGATSSIVQQVVHAFIENGSLEDALDLARNSMAARMRTLCQAISERLPGCIFETPQGGIYLWLEIPGIEGSRAFRLAEEAGVAVVPGKVFVHPPGDIEAVRLSVSRISAVMINEAVERMAEAWKNGK
ncbi:MAG: PLP-dependent aminotransferase family protein [Thermovirgaceae bacterium]|nr:PLP-dependent aminotransferase family protein [Thermovirgaceae bacterium]